MTGIQCGQIWNLIKTFGIKKDLIDKYPKHNNINNTEQHIEYKINYIFNRFKNKSGFDSFLKLRVNSGSSRGRVGVKSRSSRGQVGVESMSSESVPLAGRIVLSLLISCVQKKIDENDLLNIMMALFHFDCFAVLSNVVTWSEKITFTSQNKPLSWLENSGIEIGSII